MVIDYNTPDNPTPGGGSRSDETESDADENTGTLIQDASCAPQKISFPQDINILNEAREDLEAIIDDICDKCYCYKPRMYREKYRKNYLNLADNIYRNRVNLKFCKDHGIRLSGLALGRPRKNAKTDKRIEYADNVDRIAIERAFALAKQKYVLGLVNSKLDQTTRSSIALSVIAMNVDQIYRSLLCLIFDIVLSRFKQHNFMRIFIQNTHKKELVSC